MNFQFSPILKPIKVLMINSLTVAAQLTIVKILTGRVFGRNQLIDMILLVYSNETTFAEELKLELVACGFTCTNTIEISSDLPSITDADVFCITTKFPNPNCIDFTNLNTDDHFDTLYLITKVSSNWSYPEKKVVEQKPEQPLKSLRKPPPDEVEPIKPIIMTDGLVALDIIKSLSSNLPSDILFCPSAIPTITKNVLADTLKVRCNVINDVFAWTVNDKVFHVEIEKPLIVYDHTKDTCNADGVISNEVMESANLDPTQFSVSWLKKEFIEKIALLAAKNPYGEIYKAAELAQSLHTIWKARSTSIEKSYTNMGVISDGSLDTLKGYPYVMPLIFTHDTWSINKRFRHDTHVRQEIKRMNKAVKEHHNKLIPYCKKFLEENVFNQAFVPTDDSSTHFSMTMDQNSSSTTSADASFV